MLKMSVREKIQNLILHPEFRSIHIVDSRNIGKSIGTYIDIHVNDDEEREPIFSLLHDIVGAEFKEKIPHEPREDGKQVFPYDLVIDGAIPYLSGIYFTETQKEKAPASTEAPEEISHIDYTTKDMTCEDDMPGKYEADKMGCDYV